MLTKLLKRVPLFTIAAALLVVSYGETTHGQARSSSGASARSSGGASGGGNGNFDPFNGQSPFGQRLGQNSGANPGRSGGSAGGFAGGRGRGQGGGKVIGQGGGQVRGNSGGSSNRSVSFSENGKTVSINESDESGITITVTEEVDGIEKKDVVKAASVDELRKKHPKAFELYKKHTSGPATSDANSQLRDHIERLQKENAGDPQLQGVFDLMLRELNN